MNEPPIPPSPADSVVNILLVDDEPRNLDVLEAALQAPGYNLVRAPNAERALLLLLEGEFAAIVLDIQMPTMSGIELANLIKQRRRTQHIPIIFLTAYYLGDKDVLEGYEIGAVDYLTKPINPQILRSKIAVFVDLFRKSGALARMNEALEAEVDQRKQAEASLRSMNSELERRVQARTADLVRVNEELSARARALWASEAQLRLVTDHAPVYITQLDRYHRFKFVNRTYARSFGVEPEQLVGKHFAEVMGDGPYQTIQPHIEAALEGSRVEFEAEVPFAGLGARWVYVIHEPERTPEGEVIGLVAVVTDITDRKQAELEVALARDKALAASLAKDNFLARLSHELRTPLSPVLLIASEATANLALPAAVRADFETIAQHVMLEARLIDDLLDLTAIARSKITLKTKPVPVHALLHDSLGMLRQDFTQKNLRLVLKLDAARHTILGDDTRLKQIFWNVLRNAVKFTPAAGEITIETATDPATDRLVVKVTDTGIGMTAHELSRIFSEFSQGDHAALRGGGQFGGLGLGLVIAQTLVRLHSGTIQATSPGRDQGSVFVFEFPLSAESAVAVEKPESDNGGAAPRNLAHGLRILLVEDHPPTARTLSALLGLRHYRVVAADCIAAALLRAGEGKFDLVISDIGLPDGDGCELMAELRRRHGLTGIALTGYGMNEDVSRSRAAGFIAHLTKPVRVQDLDKALALATAEAV
ncbi:MAG: response regulator [Opitutaceae bacterium]